MTQILSLPDARFHLRVGSEVPDEILAGYIAAAQSIVEDELGRPIVDQLHGWDTVDRVPANVLHAVRIVLTDVFENRQTPLEEDAPLRRLIGRHMKLSFG